MTSIGKWYVCDRCGMTEFVDHIGDVEWDSVYYKVRGFEKPIKWTYQLGVGDLCPYCSEAYNRTIEHFKNKK